MDLIYPKHRCYPPAPNWYSLYVTAVVEPHVYLYLSRNLVIVLALQDFRYCNSFTAAEDKVEVIAAHGKHCYTAAAADKTVRLWDFMSGSLISTHNEHSVSAFIFWQASNADMYANGRKTLLRSASYAKATWSYRQTSLASLY